MKKLAFIFFFAAVAISSTLGQAPSSITGLTFRSAYSTPPLDTVSAMISVDFLPNGTYMTRLSTIGGSFGAPPVYEMPTRGTYTYTVISQSQATLTCSPSIFPVAVISALTFSSSSQGTAEILNGGSPGALSFILTPTGGASSTRALINMSTLISAKQGAPVTFGFVIGGTPLWREILIRAIGPSLAQFGVNNYAANPIYTLNAGTSLLPGGPINGLFAGAGEFQNGGSNAAWAATNASSVTIASENARAGAFQLVSGSNDKADVYLLSPGVYTLTINPTNSSGEGAELVEVYEVP